MADCPDCKKHLEEIGTLGERIKQLETQCDSLHEGKDRCMLKPEHKGSHVYIDESHAWWWGTSG